MSLKCCTAFLICVHIQPAVEQTINKQRTVKPTFIIQYYPSKDNVLCNGGVADLSH